MSLGKSPTQYKGVLAKTPPNLIFAERAPVDGVDIAFVKGDIWVDTSALTSYQFAAVGGAWIVLGSGAVGGIVTLTGDSGGAISPIAGNIDIVGDATDGVSVVGTAGTLTINVAPATTTQRGTLETSTNAESVTGTDATVAVTPASLTARLAAPGAIGGTTPGSGSFTTVDATTTVTAGTDLISTAGNVLINGAGKQLRVKGGLVTDFIGEATLALGTVTVANTNIASTDRIFITRRSINGSTALGDFTYSINAATSFTILSVQPAAPAVTETNDTSIVEYHIVRQI